jgi:DNA-binding response OmpR family regulator
MKPRLVLLFTRDRSFDRELSQALFGTGTIVLITRSVRDALQVVGRRGCELDLAVVDLDDGSCGMALLSAVHTCYQHLPILVTTSKDEKNANVVAYANGARACLNRPMHANVLANAIANLSTPSQPLIAA